MSANPQQQQTDQTANFFWLIAIITAVVLILWWLARQWIVAPMFYIRLGEIAMIRYFVDLWAQIATPLHLPIPDMHILEKLRKFILHTNPSEVVFLNFAEINTYIGQWMRFPTMLVLFVLAMIIHFRHSLVRFRNTYDMDSLKKVEVENWPQITPVMSINLVKEDIEKGPWAMAKTPLDFCKENNLLTVKRTETKSTLSILRGPTQRIIALQLGPLWKGMLAQPIHVKAILVICLARAERDRDVSKKILLQLASSTATGKLDFSGVEELARKYQNVDILKWLEKRHAYLYTLMASLLEIARTDGVVATAEFLWLKAVDRRLWYVLNNVGRQTAFVEVAGPYAHWLAEKKLGQSLKTPMVKEAVNALEVAMEETLYIAEGDRWHISSAA